MEPANKGVPVAALGAFSTHPSRPVGAGTCGGWDLWGPGVLPSPVLTEYGPGPCTCSREYCRPYLGTECAELLSLNIRGL